MWLFKYRNKIKFNKKQFFGKYKLLLNCIILYEGKLIFENNTTYEGKFKNNMYHGYGKLKNNFFKIKGNFTNNYIYGNAIISFDNINFDGEFTNNVANGTMKITYDKYSFNGSMTSNKANGYGILKYNNQIIYDGEWKNNFPLNTNELKKDFDYKLPKLCKIIYSII